MLLSCWSALLFSCQSFRSTLACWICNFFTSKPQASFNQSTESFTCFSGPYLISRMLHGLVLVDPRPPASKTHCLMLCCDGWGTSCASTKIGLGNITQTVTYFLNQHRIDRASPPMKQATLLNILVCHERSFYWISEPAYSLQQKGKKRFASVQFSMSLIIHVWSISGIHLQKKKTVC